MIQRWDADNPLGNGHLAKVPFSSSSSLYSFEDKHHRVLNYHQVFFFFQKDVCK